MGARTFGGALLVSTAIATLGASASFAQDAFMDEARAYIETVTAPVTEWTGPTTGPEAQPGKLVIYVSDDQRNGGARGVGDGAKEAAEAIGWDFRLLDGQGAPATRASALTQAMALQPDGIILGTIDAREQAPLIEQAVAQGIKVVGWHSGGAPGPIEGVPGVITNITTDPLEVAKASGLFAVVDSGGTAGVIIFTEFDLRDRDCEERCDRRGGEGLLGLHGAGDGGYADRRSAEPHGATHHVACSPSTATNGPIRSQ